MSKIEKEKMWISMGANGKKVENPWYQLNKIDNLNGNAKEENDFSLWILIFQQQFLFFLNRWEWLLFKTQGSSVQKKSENNIEQHQYRLFISLSLDRTAFQISVSFDWLLLIK